MAIKRKSGAALKKAKKVKQQDMVSSAEGIEDDAATCTKVSQEVIDCDIVSTEVVLEQPALDTKENQGVLAQSSSLKPFKSSKGGGDDTDDIRLISESKASPAATNTSVVAYRRSSRIQEIEKKVKEVSSSSQVLKTVSLTKKNEGSSVCTKVEEEVVPADGKEVVKVTKVRVSASQQQKLQELPSSYSASQIEDPEASQKVKETLRLFNTYYLRAVQEEEVRCQKEATKENVTSKKKDKKKDVSDEPRKSRRPDLKAISQMKYDKKVYLTEKGLGQIQGIHVGDHFFSRCEMMAVGLHTHWLAGIDYLGAAYKKSMPNWSFPVAISIVLSGCYEDDVDNAMDVVYTGQGGNDLLGKKHQIADQVMEKGNLALKNSMEQNLPVRLIRGNKTKKSYTGKVYTYDGLYKVKEYWAEKGKSGFTVYKFLLRRMEGQPVLTTDQVHFVSGEIPSEPSELRGLVCADLSNGLERIPVPASNAVDEIPSAPSFRYLATNEVDKNVPEPIPAKGCNCKGECYDVAKCSCAALNGKKFPYVSMNGGRLVEAMDVVYECGPHCGCGPNCSNRVTQRGMRYRLEVFKTASKGWAVRSWDTIPAGAPVCEYTGILMRTADADDIGNNEYLFELDCLQTISGIGDRQRRRLMMENNSNAQEDLSKDVPDQPEYCIDAGSSGNVSRFINHSCEPNLFVQCVLNDHHDLSRSRVWLCAADTIPPLQELSYDYGYELNSVVKNGEIKVLPCYCGAHTCRKRLH